MSPDVPSRARYPQLFHTATPDLHMKRRGSVVKRRSTHLPPLSTTTKTHRLTGAGHVAAATGDYERALQAGVRCVPLLIETFGGFGPGLMGVLRQADDWRQGRLVSSEYDETTWAARSYMAFVTQRISVAIHISLAQEIAEALGLSVATDPRE